MSVPPKKRQRTIQKQNQFVNERPLPPVTTADEQYDISIEDVSKDISEYRKFLEFAIKDSTKFIQKSTDITVKAFNEKFRSLQETTGKNISEIARSMSNSLDGLIADFSDIEKSHSISSIKALKKQQKQFNEYLSGMENISEQEKKFLSEKSNYLQSILDKTQKDNFLYKKTIGNFLKDKVFDITGILTSSITRSPLGMMGADLVKNIWEAKKEKKEKVNQAHESLYASHLEHLEKGILDGISRINPEKQETPEVENVIKVNVPEIEIPEQQIIETGDNSDLIKHLEKISDNTTFLEKLHDFFVKESFDDQEVESEQIRRDEAIVGSLERIADNINQPVEEKKKKESNTLRNILLSLIGFESFKGIKDFKKAFNGLFLKSGKVLSKMGKMVPKFLFSPLKTLEKSALAAKNMFKMEKIIGPLMKPVSKILSIGKGILKPIEALIPLTGTLGKAIPIIGEVIMVLDGIYQAFSGWTNTAERFGKENVNMKDKFVSAIGSIFESFGGSIDILLGLVGIKTSFKEWIFNNVTKPFDDLVNMNFIEVFDLAVEEIKSIFSWENIKAGASLLWEWSPQGMLLDFIANVKNWITEKFDIFGSLKKENIDLSAIKNKKDLVSNLDKANVINYERIGESEILDWKYIEKMNADKLKMLKEFDDWNEGTIQRLEKLIKQKESLAIATRDNGMIRQKADRIAVITEKKEIIEKKKEDKEMTKATQLNQMNNVTNTHINQSSVSMPASSSDPDVNTQQLTMAFCP